ncbi:MAG: hypothetical protein COC22_01850 [Flavobacteriaceae bacterium]|nr:MAG: hypothetical protein COC22_01850 [Flavobacteriaceae bacterium]
MLEENIIQEVKYGSCWARIIASILDDCIISLLIMATIFMGFVITYVTPDVLVSTLPAFFLLSMLLVCTLPIIYTVTLVASKKQSTFAMRWFDLIIVNKNMQRLSLWHSLGRFVVFILVSVFTSGLGFLTALFRDDKRGLHDIICETYVIYKK